MGRKSALASWLLPLEPADLEKILLRREDAAESKPDSLRRLADELATPSSVRRAVDALDQACLDVLNAVLHLGDGVTVEVLAKALSLPRKDAPIDRALSNLRTSALLWPDEDGGLHLVGGLRAAADEPPTRITPAPPAPRRVARSTSAAGPPTSTVDGVTRLVELCDAEPITVRRYGGGIGVRELRRIGGLLHADEQRVRLWLELAVQAELLAVEELDRRALITGGETPQHLLPSTTSDSWRASPSTGKARLQAALTAVVSGLPSAELSALLDLTADADERDTASVWRFSPASVRRALDQGATASRCSATSRRSPRATCRSR